jgi:uncharacterized protein (TIGR02466 family)
MNRVLLFPTPIWTDNFQQIDNSKILNFALSQKENAFKKTPFGNGVRTAGEEIFSPELKELRNTVQNCMEEIQDQVKYLGKKLNLIGGWIYFTTEGDWQPPHTHANGTISCCYYVKVPEDSMSVLFFDDPRVQRDSREGSIIYSEENMLNHSRVPFNPKDNDFIAFPSWLSHYVAPSRSKEERIMITLDYELK